MKNLRKQHDKIIDSLDFSGGQNSFFDFWHMHYDFRGEGNESFNVRIEYIQEGFRIYDALKDRLINYPYSFQLWIGIDEEDSGNDAVYIHTPNPNNNYFPHLIENKQFQLYKNSDLRTLIEQSGFEVIKTQNFNTNYYMLYKNGVGIELKK
jgi:hypothetical protein